MALQQQVSVKKFWGILPCACSHPCLGATSLRFTERIEAFSSRSTSSPESGVREDGGAGPAILAAPYLARISLAFSSLTLAAWRRASSSLADSLSLFAQVELSSSASASLLAAAATNRVVAAATATLSSLIPSINATTCESVAPGAPAPFEAVKSYKFLSIMCKRKLLK